MSAPGPLPWHFGGYSPAPGLETIPGTELAWIPSHCEDGKALLLSQFRNKPRIEAALCALLEGVQDLDDATWQVLTERWLDTAIAVQLDRLGVLLNLPRRGWNDDTYRALLAAQILVLRSDGTWRDLFAVLVAIGLDGTLIAASESYPAGIIVEAGQPLPIDGHDIFGFLERARGAGIRLEFTFPTTDVGDSFTFAPSSSIVADAARGFGDTLDASVGGLLSDVIASTTVSG